MPPVKKWEDGGGGHWLVRMEWCPTGGVSASVNLALHHKVEKFSSGTGSPGWSRKKGCKAVVVWWWCMGINKLNYKHNNNSNLCSGCVQF